ncbi:MAG: hypothetical protein JO182_10570 [Acidobacteriaceae bacterium]|nr:hypothetical protein [Acidobacteriaceae bacterium]
MGYPLGPHPVTLHYRQRIVISVLVLGSALIFFLHLFSRLRLGAYTSQTPAPSWRQIFCLLTPFTFGYLGALSIQGTGSVPIWDRYLLPLQAVGLIFLLRYYQDFVAQNGKWLPSTFTIGHLPAISYLALLAFAYYAIAGTHDWFALDRARLEAAEEVRRSGVPRTAIQAGFDYDGWTQLEAGGYINYPGIRIPPDAFRPTPPPNLPAECTTWFAPLAPTIVPRYFLVYTPLSCFAPSPFPPITYHAWMPPFTRQIYVQQRKD